MVLELNDNGDIQERIPVDISEARRRLEMLQDQKKQMLTQISEMQTAAQNMQAEIDGIKAVIASYKKGG